MLGGRGLPDRLPCVPDRVAFRGDEEQKPLVWRGFGDAGWASVGVIAEAAVSAGGFAVD